MTTRLSPRVDGCLRLYAGQPVHPAVAGALARTGCATRGPAGCELTDRGRCVVDHIITAHLLTTTTEDLT